MKAHDYIVDAYIDSELTNTERIVTIHISANTKTEAGAIVRNIIRRAKIVVTEK